MKSKPFIISAFSLLIPLISGCSQITNHVSSKYVGSKFINSNTRGNISKEFCKVPRVKKDFIYINGKKINSRFIGCWQKANKKGFYYISHNKNKLNIVYLATNLGPERDVDEYVQVSNIKLYPYEISAIFYVDINDFYTKRTFTLLNENKLNVNWKQMGGPNKGQFSLYRYD